VLAARSTTLNLRNYVKNLTRSSEISINGNGRLMHGGNYGNWLEFASQTILGELITDCGRGD
jgi:hypothetical protein